jgi:DNA-binding GntR family transcriptional regulator
MSLDVYDEIRALIARGHYLGGDAMPEQELAERLGVSRTPVREALRRLMAEGVVERRSNRRTHLAEMDRDRVVDIFAVRAALEPVGARLAATGVTADFLDDLAACIHRMDAALAVRQPDLRAYRQGNEDFHWAILARSGNATLDATVRGVSRRPIVSPTFNGWTAEELARSQGHHRELLAAFEANDPEWAEAVMRCHMVAARAVYQRLAEG